MSTKAIVFQDFDNHDTCSIVVLAEATSAEEHLEHLKHLYSIGEYPLNPANGRIINYPDDIPSDRTFRNAWTDEHDTPTVDIDLDKAKEIHLNRIREERNKELEKTDKEFVVALSKGLDTTEITEKKQELRDIPQEFEATVSKCETVEELKSCWPEDLELHPIYLKENE